MLGWMDEVFVLFAWVKVHAWIMYRLVYKWLHIEVSDCDIGFAVLCWNFVLNFQLSAIGPPKHGRTKEMDVLFTHLPENHLQCITALHESLATAIRMLMVKMYRSWISL